MDSYKYNLVEQVLLLSSKMKLSGEYIENMPRLERKKAIEIVNHIIEKEQEQAENDKEKMKRIR